MKDKDGGPAFPSPHMAGQTGLTIRDYFAAKAMAAFIAEPCWESGCGLKPMFTRHDGGLIDELPAIATSSYAMADAMLAAREAKP